MTARPQKNEFWAKKLIKIINIFCAKKCAYHRYYRFLQITVFRVKLLSKAVKIANLEMSSRNLSFIKAKHCLYLF